MQLIHDSLMLNTHLRWPAIALYLFTWITVSSCSTSPLGRSQLTMVPDTALSTMGVQAFAQMKKDLKRSSDPKTLAYVRCVIQPLLNQLPDGLQNKPWEIEVFVDPTANAFALPGFKIGVHTGLLSVAKTDGQLAAVVGHEIGHVIARHGNERVSHELATKGGLTLASLLTRNHSNQQTILSLLGAGAQLGVVLPFSRTHESEADEIGQQLMADAGFDPAQSVRLWENMMAASKSAPPEFLSTHPSNKTRIAHLSLKLQGNMQRYEAAKKQGRSPSCQREGIANEAI